MRIIAFIIILILPNYAFEIEKDDMVLVVKSEAKLYLMKNNKALSEYKVVFGANPKGHKQKEGAIMIHGQKNGLGRLSWIAQRFNWTDGCIAVSNSAMDEIWESVSVGTPIRIKP